jgi:hypothetical protein
MATVTQRLTGSCFGPQRTFLEDDATFATADCSRRAGKSNGIAKWLLEGPIGEPEAPSLYFTISRKEAKRIIWGTMKKLNRELNLGYEPNESELILYRAGFPSVYLTGVNTKDEIEKARGTGWGRVAADEAQTLPQYVQDMINDVLLPSFIDYGGKLRVIGTPGPVPVGFFHATTQNAEYTHHHWTVWDNPFLRDKAPGMLEKTLRVRGLSRDDPSIQREWFGKWVYDPESLVFKFDPQKNCYESLPLLAGTWQYCIGIDIGYEDADALVVLAWNSHDTRVWVTDELIQNKQDVTSLASMIRGVYERLGRDKVVAMVMDTGGAGLKIAEELSARHALPVSAAEKQHKQSYIELVNDALRTGRLLVKAAGRFAHDSLLVEWDHEKTTPDKRVISERFHSDVCDALLYAYREALGWFQRVPIPKPVLGSPEWAAQERRRMFERAQAEVLAARQNTNEWGVDLSGWGEG